MATFTGRARDSLNYEVVRPEDGRTHHVREQHASKTLCGAGCDWLADRWACLEDVHPEDADADARCQRCYEILDNRHRRARGEAPRTSRRRQRRPAGIVVMPERTSLGSIRAKVAERDRYVARANADLAGLIRAAQDAGEPMAAIAEALGMTRQALYGFLKRHG